MIKVPEETNEGMQSEERGKPFAKMIRTEIRVERCMKWGRDSSSEEVTLSDTVLEVSTFNYFAIIEGDGARLWKIVDYIIILISIDCMDDGISKEKWGV